MSHLASEVFQESMNVHLTYFLNLSHLQCEVQKDHYHGIELDEGLQNALDLVFS